MESLVRKLEQVRHRRLLSPPEGDGDDERLSSQDEARRRRRFFHHIAGAVPAAGWREPAPARAPSHARASRPPLPARANTPLDHLPHLPPEPPRIELPRVLVRPQRI